MGLTRSVDPCRVQMGAWQVQIRAPARMVQPLRAILSHIEIPEQGLPPLAISVAADGFARGMVDGKEAWAHPLPRRDWLTILLGYAVATATSLLRELLFLHAGAIEIGGRGSILVGSPGAGKTSIVGSLLRRGAAYLSDEVAVLDPKAGAVHAFSLPLAVKPWTAQAMGAFPPGRLLAADDNVRYLLPDRRAQGPVPVDWLVLLDPSAPASRPVEMPRGEMLLALSRQASSFRHRDRLDAAFSGFVRIVRRARCVRLGSGVPADAARILADLHGLA